MNVKLRVTVLSARDLSAGVIKSYSMAKSGSKRFETDLARSSKTSEGLWQKIRNWFSKLLNRIFWFFVFRMAFPRANSSFNFNYGLTDLRSILAVLRLERKCYRALL